MPLFEKPKYSLVSCINWGILDTNGVMEYPTKEGVKKAKPENIGQYFRCVNFSDIDLEASFYQWRKSNPRAYGKPFSVNMDITDGEVYTRFNLPVMIKQTETDIFLKPIYEQ